MLPVSVDQQFRVFEIYLRASHLIINLGGTAIEEWLHAQKERCSDLSIRTKIKFKSYPTFQLKKLE